MSSASQSSSAVPPRAALDAGAETSTSGVGGGYPWKLPPFNASDCGGGGGGGSNWWPCGGGGASGANNWGFPGIGADDNGGGGGVGAGTIVLVAVLVTGFSLLALLLLRLWLCGCNRDDDARGGRRRRSVTGGTDSKAAVVTGLRPEVIESFQVVGYRALVGIKGEDDCCCPVCITEFSDDDKRIRVLPGCGHCFHPECVDEWLGSHTSCPVCRRELVPPQSTHVSIEIPSLQQMPAASASASTSASDLERGG